jgi:hypothetical protein
MLAVCPQLPPSMHRKEWCLDDYIITDKLYKGYASMGEQQAAAGAAHALHAKHADNRKQLAGLKSTTASAQQPCNDHPSTAPASRQ